MAARRRPCFDLPRSNASSTHTEETPASCLLAISSFRWNGVRVSTYQVSGEDKVNDDRSK